MEAGTIFILLFIVVTAVAIAVQRLAVPYTVALVITGLVLWKQLTCIQLP